MKIIKVEKDGYFFSKTKIMSKLESQKKLNIYCETVKVEI